MNWTNQWRGMAIFTQNVSLPVLADWRQIGEERTFRMKISTTLRCEFPHLRIFLPIQNSVFEPLLDFVWRNRKVIDEGNLAINRRKQLISAVHKLELNEIPKLNQLNGYSIHQNSETCCGCFLRDLAQISKSDSQSKQCGENGSLLDSQKLFCFHPVLISFTELYSLW